MKIFIKKLFNTNEMNLVNKKIIINNLCKYTNIEKYYIDIITTSTLNLVKEYILNIRSEIPLISNKRMELIVVACFWISMKFHSDDHSLFGALDFGNSIIDFDINPDHIIIEEFNILQKLNFNIWKFMKE